MLNWTLATGLGAFLALALILLMCAYFFYRLIEANRVQASEIVRLDHELVRTQAEIENYQFRIRDREQTELALRNAAKSEFESLAQRLIETETRQFESRSEKSLERLLTPLKERLKDFEKRVEESYQIEGKERFLLKAEVERLIQLGNRMSNETTQLTQALKGESKIQGDWGELILENILHTSGLREGIEYSKQGSFTNDVGDRYRPDIIINLPDQKQIIVDSKVSLKSFELYCRAETPEDREMHLRAHMNSIENHVEELSGKHYSKLKGMRSPEFVFLFAPIEPAYVLAMKSDSALAERAWKKGVAIVTATTLFTSLKTVASIWRLEHQNRNAQEIAQEAARLYDKFVGFYEDFEKVGRLLESGMSQYEEARRKLRDGPGNVFRKIELLRELGAAPNKRIKPELLE